MDEGSTHQIFVDFILRVALSHLTKCIRNVKTLKVKKVKGIFYQQRCLISHKRIQLKNNSININI